MNFSKRNYEMFRTMRVFGCSAMLFAALTALPSSASAAPVPAFIHQQGRLFDAAGAPVEGSVNITFTIYSQATGGAVRWTETQSVVLASGFFSTRLGQDTGVDPTIFDGSVLYLGIKVGSDPEMTPRQSLDSVPYAFLANNVVGDITPKSISIAGKKVIDATGKWVGDTTGLIGAAGPAGAAGPTGAAGPAGAVGPIGPMGPAGLQGPKGDTGAAGPAGATGSQGLPGAAGAQGPAGANWTDGPGVLVSGGVLSGPRVGSDYEDALTAIPSTCVNYAKIPVDFPTAGSVLIQANAWLAMNHANGTTDTVSLAITNSATDCGTANLWHATWSASASLPSNTLMEATVPISSRFFATAPYNGFLYLNGIMLSGSATPDYFFYAVWYTQFIPD